MSQTLPYSLPAAARLRYEASMTDEPELDDREDPPSGSVISRRTALTTGAAALAGVGGGVGGAALLWSHSHGPAVWQQPNRTGAPPVLGLHLQFGKNAGTEVVVSWHSTDAVSNPRVLLGTPTSGFGSTVPAKTRTYRDAKSNNEVRVN